MSHYTFDNIRINLEKKEINYEIKTYEKWNNESAQKVILIDKIRLALFKIQPYEWVGISYKKGKKIPYGI